MSSIYDDELISYLKISKVKGYRIIEEVEEVIEFIMEKFRFQNGRVCLYGNQNERYIESNAENISDDVEHFIEELIEEKICNMNEKVIYIGDSLTENGYELCMSDAVKIVSYLVNEIPQHHYFYFEETNKLIFISFENEIMLIHQGKTL